MSDPASDAAPIVPGVVVVCFDDVVNIESAAAGTARALPNLALDHVISRPLNMVLFRIADATSVADMVGRLSERAAELNVRWAEPSYVATLASASVGPPPYPDDPLYPLQWGLPRIGAPLLWNQVPNNVRIAIIDSGVPCTPARRLTHPDLMKNIILKTNYVGDGTFDDVIEHGTHMTGICGADANNGIGITGVAWNFPKFIYKAVGRGSANTPNMVQAISDAVTDTPAGQKVVINLSLGINNPTSQLQAACDLVAKNDAILCAATGNEGWTDQVVYPAAYCATNTAVIAVGAVDCNNKRAYFSNCKPGYVTVVAPGVGILSCSNKGDFYAYDDGTSTATAFATGMVAQIWAKRGGSRDQIVDWVKRHCIALTDTVPSPETGYGLIVGITDESVTGTTLSIEGDVI